jgi:hypothetical protein
MTDSPPLPACVVDSSVLIDLHVGELLRSVFRLPLFLMASDVLIAELQEPGGDLLVDYGLTRVELSGGDVQKVSVKVIRILFGRVIEAKAQRPGSDQSLMCSN